MASSKVVSYYFDEHIGVHASAEASIVKPYICKCVSAAALVAMATGPVHWARRGTEAQSLTTSVRLPACACVSGWRTS